jgi:hypothetical protein
MLYKRQIKKQTRIGQRQDKTTIIWQDSKKDRWRHKREIGTLLERENKTRRKHERRQRMTRPGTKNRTRRKTQDQHQTPKTKNRVQGPRNKTLSYNNAKRKKGEREGGGKGQDPKKEATLL